MQSRIWRLVTPPISEPVSLAEIKTHLRVDHNAEDDLITLYAQAARQAIEDECGIALGPQTWRLHLDAWPDERSIEVPRPPLASIISVTWRDATGGVHLLAPDNYRAQTDAWPGSIELMPAATWPVAASLDAVWPITIEYIAGYPNPAAVPTIAKAALLLLTGELYQNREAATPAALIQTPALQRLLALLQVPK
jgi:uncharacterized phiE125 gp8 family phage protein